jgi:predicted glycosyltransferase
MTLRVFHYVQHLQGVGHVVRSRRIANALRHEGFAVTMVLGGMPVPGRPPEGVDVIHLPPLKAGANSFRELATETGGLADEKFKAERRRLLCGAFERTKPDIVLIEAFPFDRPQMHFELIPLLEAATVRAQRPLIASSIRDILQKKTNPERDATARDLLHRFFDHILVHGDARLARLEETFPYAHDFAGMTTYTGIVAPEPVTTPPRERYDVIVSTGGGATAGHRVVAAAIEAKPRSSLADASWLALIGPYVDNEECAALGAMAEANGVTLMPFVADLAQLLAHARLSISQAGYNTVADLLRTGCRAVLCPYAGIRQNEQTTRSTRLSERGLATMVADTNVSAASIAAAIDQAMTAAPPQLEIDLNGARASARTLVNLMQQRT